MRDKELTQDGIFSRAITLWQPKKGYRFGVDSVLLGIFSRESAAMGRVLDLGAGVGVVSLILAFRTPEVALPKEIVAVELQPRLAELCRRNVAANAPLVPVRVVEGDLKEIHKQLGPERFDLVVSNPPYYAVEEGQRGLDDERAIARQEISATIADVLAAAARFVTPGGKLALVYPVPQLPRLFAALSDAPFQLTVLQPVYARAGEEATLALLMMRQKTSRKPPPLVIPPPYILADKEGKPDPEMELLLRRGF